MEMTLASAFGMQIVNMALLAILVSIYVRNLVSMKKMKMRPNFTVGLLIFAAFLLMQNAVSVFLQMYYMEAMTGPFENYAFAVQLTETIAILALFWVSWK